MTAEPNVDLVDPAANAAPPAGRVSRLLRDLMRTRLDKSGSRLRLVALGFVGVFCLLSGKLIWIGFRPDTSQNLKAAASDAVSGARPDILDRNGAIMATDIKQMSVFAEPRRLIDKDEAVELLTAVLPDIDANELRQRLGSRKGFVWIKRGVTPSQQAEVYRLGLPGIGFVPENRRVYPSGPIGAHVLGFTNLDNQGIAGIEKYIDGQGLADLHGAGFKLTPDDLKPITLSLDLNATHAVRDELAKGIAHFKAKSGAAAIMDVNTGEMIAFTSLPDFDPNNPVDALDPDHIDRLTVGTYEMGSTFKSITAAMALEAGKVTLKSMIDARDNLRYGRFTIHDFEPKHRMLSVPEAYKFSSNISFARMAMMVGVEGHKAFLRKMGQLTRLRTELPENAEPIVPRNWSELNTMTIAFGQGINVAPLQAMMAVAGLTNGGNLITPTFLRRESDARSEFPRVIRPETSESLRYLMRLNAVEGSAKKANIPGFFAGGKTGTADKIIHGHYDHSKVFTTFMSIIPADHPKYLFLVLMDEPQAVEGTYGFHTAAWNSGTVCGSIMERVAPLLNMPPMIALPQQPFPYVARLGIGMDNLIR